MDTLNDFERLKTSAGIILHIHSLKKKFRECELLYKTILKIKVLLISEDAKKETLCESGEDYLKQATEFLIDCSLTQCFKKCPFGGQNGNKRDCHRNA